MGKTEKNKRPGQKDLHLLKPLLSLPSGLFYRRGVSFRPRNSYRWRRKRQRGRKLTSSVQPYRPTSLTVEDSRLQSRGSLRSGKGQFSILFRKIGRDHTLTVNPVQILGEPILSISALKAPLCRQRYLRICPLYLCHMEQIKRRAVRGKPVILFPGNKKLWAFSSVFLIFIVSLFGSLLSAKSMHIKVKEKELQLVRQSLEENNEKLMRMADYEVY